MSGTRSEWDWFGFPFGFAAMGRTRGRRRGRRQWFESGDMKYVILKLLREKPMHGYEVMKALEERTSGCYKPSPGTVYPTLQWLEDEGLVRGSEVEGKKVYEITDAGRAFLDEHRGVVDEIFERITETIDRVTADPLPEVSRAVGRLVSQTYRTAWRLGDDRARGERLVALLEQTTEAIRALTTEPAGE